MKTWIDRIPPHIRYPGMVVTILLGSVISQVILFQAATSNGGPQIESDYYQRALDWDEHREQLRKSQRLGWSLHCERMEGGRVEVTLRDSAGRPLENLQGTVELHRPQLAESLGKRPLATMPARSGVYHFSTPPEQSGLWDFVFTIERPEGEAFFSRVRFDDGAS